MVASYERRYKLANPAKAGRRVRVSNRRMTLRQKLHFGSKRQRAAAKVALSGHRRRNAGRKSIRRSVKEFTKVFRPSSREKGNYRRRIKRRVKQSNVGQILTYRFKPLTNSSHRKRGNSYNMAKVGRKRKYHRRRTYNSHRRRARANPRHFSYRHRRRSNPKVIVRYRTRGRRPSYRHRRRNPGIGGMFSGRFGKVFGVIGGGAVTKLISDRLPLGLNTGFMGYIATAVVAILQGKLVGKVFKSPALGDDMVIGGFTYLALKVVQDLFPSFGTALPFGLRGMGLLGSSNFYVPQVNQRGSMGSFLVPPGIPAPVVMAKGMHGLVNNAQGGGRMGLRRMGRMS